jgi:hypothetical protein
MSEVHLLPLRFAHLTLIVLFLACPPRGRADPEGPTQCSPVQTALPTPLHDCNGNGIEDMVDIALGTSSDADLDGVPDECQARGPTPSGPES